MTPPAAAAAIPATLPAPARRGAPTAPARPARTRPSHPRRAAEPARRQGRAAEVAAALAPARMMDRLIRSRSWIGVVAFALIGIVAMQLWLLKLNGGIGRAIEHEGLLQRENAVLSAENSSMSAGDLIEQQAAASGMRIVSPGSLIFLRARGGMDERLAAARLARPVQTPTQSESTTSTSTAPTQSESATSTSTVPTQGETTTPTSTAPTQSEGTAQAATGTAGRSESATPTEGSPQTTGQMRGPGHLLRWRSRGSHIHLDARSGRVAGAGCSAPYRCTIWCVLLAAGVGGRTHSLLRLAAQRSSAPSRAQSTADL